MKKDLEPYQVNLFRPKTGYMQGEVSIMFAVLIGWGVVIFGFQLLLLLSAGSSFGNLLTSFTFFNLPFHFWFTAQMLPLWFIIICIIFNLCIDKLTGRQRKRREDYYD